jgi:hypothetical protein
MSSRRLRSLLGKRRSPSLYRLLAGRIGRGYERAETRHLFQEFVDATAKVKITESEIVARFQKRAQNPLLVAAGVEAARENLVIGTA